MEVKLQQQLALVDQEPLYQIYLDLRKAYAALDQGRCLEILAGYGVGPNLIPLQKKFWDDAKMVCHADGNYGLPIEAHQTLLEMGWEIWCVINVSRFSWTTGWSPRGARSGYNQVSTSSSTFSNGSASRTNAEKTKVMKCLPGKIRDAQTEEEYASQQTGLGTSTTKRWRVDCEVCDASLVAESLRSHLETQHDIFRSFVLNRNIVVARAPEVYRATESPATGLYFCPVAQCGGQSGTRFNLRRHFLMQHPQDLVCIQIEGSQPLPKCERCGLQTPVEDLNGGHHRTVLCQREWERKWQHAAALGSQEALGRLFTAYGEELERVEVFK
jgi:hypothetical protein